MSLKLETISEQLKSPIITKKVSSPCKHIENNNEPDEASQKELSSTCEKIKICSDSPKETTITSSIKEEMNSSHVTNEPPSTRRSSRLSNKQRSSDTIKDAEINNVSVASSDKPPASPCDEINETINQKTKQLSKSPSATPVPAKRTLLPCNELEAKEQEVPKEKRTSQKRQVEHVDNSDDSESLKPKSTRSKKRKVEHETNNEAQSTDDISCENKVEAVSPVQKDLSLDDCPDDQQKHLEDPESIDDSEEDEEQDDDEEEEIVIEPPRRMTRSKVRLQQQKELPVPSPRTVVPSIVVSKAQNLNSGKFSPKPFSKNIGVKQLAAAYTDHVSVSSKTSNTPSKCRNYPSPGARTPSGNNRPSYQSRNLSRTSSSSRIDSRVTPLHNRMKVMMGASAVRCASSDAHHYKSMARLGGGGTPSQQRRPNNIVTGITSFLGTAVQPARPTRYEMEEQRQEDLRKKREREEEIRRKKEEMIKTKGIETKKKNEERMKKVQEARLAKERKLAEQKEMIEREKKMRDDQIKKDLEREKKLKAERQKEEALKKKQLLLEQKKIAEEKKRLEEERKRLEMEEKRLELEEKKRLEQEERMKQELERKALLKRQVCCLQ